MPERPDIGDVVRGLQAAVDLLDAGDGALEALETTAGLIRRHREQTRKLGHCKPVMRPWHRWRRDRLADRIRERLNLGPTDPIPAQAP